MFTLNEVIKIIMAEIESKRNKEKYGIEQEAYLPKEIEEKILSLDNERKIAFWDKVETIADECILSMSNELNYLNNLNFEIKAKVMEGLNSYLISFKSKV